MKRNPHMWVAAGALAAGLGATWVDGAAIATADTGAASTTATVAQSASPAAALRKHSVAVAVKTPAVGSASAATASRPTPARPGPVVRATRSARTAADAVTLDPVQSLTRQLNYIFNNTAPTINAGNQSGAGGTVTGSVIGQSNNGFALTYSLGDKPRYGNVEVNATTGAYVYSPDAGAPVSAIVDEFTIVANNGTAAQVPGLLGFAQSLLHAVAIGIGLSSGDTAAVQIAVSLISQTVIGNPAEKVQYWQPGDVNTAALTSVSMVIGQLTEEMPAWDELVQQAKDTNSVVKTTTDKNTGDSTGVPRKMYNPGNYPDPKPGGPYADDNWVVSTDANQLLQIRGAVVTGTYYSMSGGLDDALINLATSLFAGESVIVYPRKDPDGTIVVGDDVTVLGLDYTKQQVYINDGGRPTDGQGRTLSLSDFIRVWGPTYETVVVKLNGATGV